MFVQSPHRLDLDRSVEEILSLVFDLSVALEECTLSSTTSPYRIFVYCFMSLAPRVLIYSSSDVVV
jgi:hypothetical protein